jgi:hypothetical protein
MLQDMLDALMQARDKMGMGDAIIQADLRDGVLVVVSIHVPGRRQTTEDVPKKNSQA